MFRYCKRFHNILEMPMLSEVNKVYKDNYIFVSFLLYFAPNPPPPPAYFDPLVYYEPESTDARDDHAIPFCLAGKLVLQSNFTIIFSSEVTVWLDYGCKHKIYKNVACNFAILKSIESLKQS